MIRIRFIAAVALALSVAAFATPTEALAGDKVLGMYVEGEALSKSDKSDLFGVLQAKLKRYPDIELVQPPEGELIDLMIDLECIDVDTDCLSKLGKKYGADKVFYPQVDADGGAFKLLVRVVDVARSKAVRDKSQKVARTADLSKALETEIESVFGAPPVEKPVVVAPPVEKPVVEKPVVVPPVEKPPVEKPPGEETKDGMLVIDTNLPNSTIYVDGEYAGTGTATLQRKPGEYVVRVVHDGYAEQIRKVSVRSDKQTTQKFELSMATVKPPGGGTVGGGGTKPGETPGGGVTKKDDDDDSSWIIWATVGAVVVGGAVAAIVLLNDDGTDAGPRGPVVLSIDPNNVWRDDSVRGGR